MFYLTYFIVSFIVSGAIVDRYFERKRLGIDTRAVSFVLCLWFSVHILFFLISFGLSLEIISISISVKYLFWAWFAGFIFGGVSAASFEIKQEER